uniref:EF-hand domain-containing protein n=1 Tax=Acrobeloides nanus TaxID=290746 RepID=A0A914DMU6_9BILA
MKITAFGSMAYLTTKALYSPAYAYSGMSEGEAKLSRRQQRFQSFASIEYRGVEYMTPLDFLESLILEEPRERIFRRVLKQEQVKKMLKNTPNLRNGSDKLFRQLGQNGLISYAEYLFLLTLLTKSQNSFNIAFLMFDEDDNLQIDKNEFLKLKELMSIKHSVNDTQLLVKDDFPASRSLTASAEEAAKQDTTILVHLFGQNGQNSLSFDKFQEFYRNLQQELIEIEFQEFSRGKTEISPVDFARLVLRYSILHRNDQSPYIKRVHERTQPEDKGISQKQFEQFSMFLNNLEEFTKAVRLYTAADLPVSRSEFIRAVKCSTGHDLDPDLVDVLYKIFDTNNDDKLSYSEFIAIMNDRLHRGFKDPTSKPVMSWKTFKDCVIREMSAC